MSDEKTLNDPMTLAARRRANARFLEAQSNYVLARTEADAAERLRDEADNKLFAAREQRDKHDYAMRMAFAALPTDLQEIYR